MPRIKFLEDFTYKPLQQQTFLYKKGDVLLVKEEIASLAINAGKAILSEVPTPPAGINETIKRFPRRKKVTVKE